MALGRRALTCLSQNSEAAAEVGHFWRTGLRLLQEDQVFPQKAGRPPAKTVTTSAGAAVKERRDEKRVISEAEDCELQMGERPLVLSSGVTSGERVIVAGRFGSLAGFHGQWAGGVNTPPPSRRRRAASHTGACLHQIPKGGVPRSGTMCPPNSFKNCRSASHIQARQYRSDGAHSFPSNRSSFETPFSDHPPHDFRGVSSETFSSGLPSSSPHKNCAFQTPPPLDSPPPPESARRTLWYGATAALLLSGGAAIAANGDVNPGKVLSTDPRAVMRSASQSMREAAHEVRARVRTLVGAASERWEEVTSSVGEVTASAGALASCLMTVLWGPLEEVEEAHSKGRSMLRARVAALIADFAANYERRNAIACAGGGKILGWLLEQVSRGEPAVRNEAARALGHFLGDRRTAGAVLMQGGAIPQLLAYCNMLPRLQMLPPMRDWGAEEDLHELDHAHPGQRLLVASLAKLVAGPDVSSWTRGIHLSSDADPDDIAAALQEMRSFERDMEEEEESRPKGGGAEEGGGIRGIGIRVMGGTSIVGVQRAAEGGPAIGQLSSLSGGYCSFESQKVGSGLPGVYQAESVDLMSREEDERRSSHSRASTSHPGTYVPEREPFILYRAAVAEGSEPLDRGPSSVHRVISWDDSTPEKQKNFTVHRAARAEVLVPSRSGPSGLGSFLLGGESSPALDEINLGGQLATWAVATWAAESSKNRDHIAELDNEGGAIVAALRHPDPSVQFHAARAIKELAKDDTKWSEGAASTWTPPLVGMLAGTLFHDPALPSRLSPGGVASSASMGVEALGACAVRSPKVREWLGQQGLGVLRRLAADEFLGGAVQGPLSRLVELLAKGGEMEKEELKLWTPILLKWTGDPASPPDVRSSAAETLKWSIDALGSDGKLVMEAWLAALLSTLTNETKKGNAKAATPQNVLQNEALAAARSALTQLEKVMEQQAAAVADVAADVAPEKRGWFGFGGGKKGPPKPVADADVLLAVSNALKALAELMAEDGARQRRVLESGAFALLTQFLLSGHFTQAVSTQQWQSAREGAGVLKEKPKPPAKVPKQKRPYVKRHALRVLANLSIHPQLGALLGGEQRLVDWLEEVAEGAVPSQRGDLKLRSFAKQTLLHLQFWRDRGPTVGEDTDVLPWPRYLDGIYLLDPASEHFRTRKGNVRKKSEEESDAGRQEPTRDGENQPWQASDWGPNGALGKDTSLEASGQERKRRLFELSISGEASRQVEGRGASEQEGMGASGQGSQRRPCDEGSAVEASADGSRGGQAQQSGEKVLPTSVTQQDTTDKSKETGVDLNQIEGNSAPQEQHPQTAVPLEKEMIEIASDSSTESASTSASQAEKLQGGGTSGVKSQPANAELALKLESSAVNAARDVSPGLKPGVQDSQTLPSSRSPSEPVFDVVFIHGLMGGPYKTWRMTDDKTSAVKAGGLVEDLGEEDRPKEGDGCWPTDWLAKDLPSARLLSTEYKTNLTEWSGATLPLQELSAHLLERLVVAGVGDRPVVFVTHSMGGLVAKQMLQLVRAEERYRALGQAVRGIVFYSCPHFGSRLADLSSRMGVVLRPAAAVGELRSGSPRLEELNKLLKKEYQKGQVDVISFSEDKVTPVVEAYGGVKLRMEVVPIESAYPGFGDLIVLKGTDHVNACKPLNRQDVAYTKTLDFLKKVEGTVDTEKRRDA